MDQFLAVTGTGYDGLNLAAYGGKVNKFDGVDGGSRIITIGQFPQGFVDQNGHVPVRDPKGRVVPLSEAFEKYKGTHVAVNDVPGLTEFLTTQPQLYSAWDEEMRQREADRYVDSISLTDPTSANQMKNLAGTIGTVAALGAAAAGGAYAIPFLAPGTVGGSLIGETEGGMALGELMNEGSKALTGRTWGENLRYGLEGTADMLGLGYNPESWNPYAQGAYEFLTDMTNPGYLNGSRWLKNAANSVYREAGKTFNKVSDI